MLNKRTDLTILGRKIGTSTGWDGDPGEHIWFYDFIPDANVHLPAGDLYFDEHRGVLYISDDKGNPIQAWDVLSVLANVPRTEPLPPTAG